MIYNNENGSSLHHIAFIADGNRRWAVQMGMPGFEGHKRGAGVFKEIISILPTLGIKYATFFLFSMENWKRSEKEVNYLMDMFRELSDSLLDIMKKKRIRAVIIGNLDLLPQDIVEKIKNMEKETKDNAAITIVMAVSYSGRDEITRAVKKIMIDAVDKKISADALTESVFESYLDTNEIPYPDIVVRTGDMRISNFLLWQIAYSEIFFLNKYWPDFNEEDLKKIIKDFSRRNRRYGR